MAGQILVGDVREQLRTLSAESAHVCVTSPPYWSLRSYSTNPQVWGGDESCAHAFEAEPTAEGYTGKRWWQNGTNAGGIEAIKRKDAPDNWSQVTRGDTCRHCGCWRGELGGELDPESYVAHIVEVFREVKRVLRRDGTCWVNLGDSFFSQGGERTYGSSDGGTGRGPATARMRPSSGLKPKDLVGIPWRVAFALQADGWYLRSDVIWSKPNPMPESVTDRPTKSHEYLFLLAKSSRYYYDADAVREAHTAGNLQQQLQSAKKIAGDGDGRGSWVASERYLNPLGRNRRSVWEIPTQPTPEAHFATYPEKLVEPCILAGTSERGVCRQCGAPWRRVVERSPFPGKDTRTPGAHTPTGNGKLSGSATQKWLDANSPTTTGWTRTCKHDAPAIPATCLDPFLGSGTTGRVAERLGRNWIGVELSESYAAIARRRTAQAGLMQWAAAAGGAE